MKNVFLYRENNAIGAASHFSLNSEPKYGYELIGLAHVIQGKDGPYIHSPHVYASKNLQNLDKQSFVAALKNGFKQA